MTETPLLLLTLLVCYLIGSVPFGYLVARWRGVDIFKQGSGNIGATNVGRVLGRKLGILVFVLDFAKGALPAALAVLLSGLGRGDIPADAVRVLAGLAAFLGHLFPVFLRFRGGKGVATGAGVVAVLLPGPAAGAALAWVAVVCATRTVSAASVVAALALVVLRLWWTPGASAADNLWLSGFAVVAAVLITAKHHANLRRLLNGTENRLKDTPAMLLLSKTIHVVALGLWFGSSVFFTFVVALSLFHTFEGLAESPDGRPAWLGDSFDKARGTQLAGIAVGPLFPTYFLLQGACAVLALATAWPWTRLSPGRTVHRLRMWCLAAALACVVVGWPLSQWVSEVRAARYSPDAAVAEAARAEFGTLHGYSLLLNFVTLGLVTVAMVLAAQLPAAPPAEPEAPKKDAG